MTTDYKALADRLVELGVGALAKGTHHPVCYFPPMSETGTQGFMSAEKFCHDWRVAGACLEKAHMVFVERHECWQVRYDKAYGDRTREWHSAESLPLAIIQAFVEDNT